MRWTAAEITMLRDAYPAGGSAAVNDAMVAAGLQRRSQRNICARACALGIRKIAGPHSKLSKPKLTTAEAVKRFDDAGLRQILHGLEIAIAETLAELKKQIERYRVTLDETQSRSE